MRAALLAAALLLALPAGATAAPQLAKFGTSPRRSTSPHRLAMRHGCSWSSTARCD
jgi:ABC-type sugar transport system substrate-binding protein